VAGCPPPRNSPSSNEIDYRLQTAHHSLPRREMVRYWLLSADDIRRINKRRREHNRLGFAVQLCLLRYPGWPLKVGDQPPSNLLEFVAQQIDADPDEFGDYAAREQSINESSPRNMATTPTAPRTLVASMRSRRRSAVLTRSVAPCRSEEPGCEIPEPRTGRREPSSPSRGVR
jgi:hypothetical protein